MEFVLIYIDTESDCIIKAFLYCNQLSNDNYRSDNIKSVLLAFLSVLCTVVVITPVLFFDNN